MGQRKKTSVSWIVVLFLFLFAGKEVVTCTKTQRFFYLFAFFIGDVFLFQCFDITFNVFKMDVQLSLIMCWVHGWECLPCFFFCIFFLNFFGIARRTFLFLVLPTFAAAAAAVLWCGGGFLLAGKDEIWQT
jgi:hypothetical protein